MIKKIILPSLGEGIESANVSEVSVCIGDKISKEDTILVLESEKASMEIPSEVSGVVVGVLVKEGDEIQPGALLIRVEVKKGAGKTREEKHVEKKEKQRTREKPDQKTVRDKESPRDHIFASPGVRKLSRELDIDLSLIRGTGPKQRITKEDLHEYIKGQIERTDGKPPKEIEKAVDFSQWGSVEIKPLTKINIITGERLQKAWESIPHVTQFDQADITVLNAYRKKLNANADEKNEKKITFLPFLMKAVAKILQEMPRFNSSLDSKKQNLIIKSYIHFGIAVSTDFGLVVPVIKYSESKSLFELSEELKDMSKKARVKKLKPEEMKGATFTISSLGGVGGTHFTPIINPPEVAILGISQSKRIPIYDERAPGFTSRVILPFSLSYDHRVIDGTSGALFTTRLAELLADETFLKNKTNN